MTKQGQSDEIKYIRIKLYTFLIFILRKGTCPVHIMTTYLKRYIPGRAEHARVIMSEAVKVAPAGNEVASTEEERFIVG